jgi:hypothetical protein
VMGIEIHDMAGADSGGRSWFTTTEFLDFAERNHVFDSVIGRSFDDMLYRTDTGTEQFAGVRGFRSGTVSKKLGLAVTSAKVEGGERTHSIKV